MPLFESMLVCWNGGNILVMSETNCDWVSCLTKQVHFYSFVFVLPHSWLPILFWNSRPPSPCRTNCTFPSVLPNCLIAFAHPYCFHVFPVTSSVCLSVYIDCSPLSSASLSSPPWGPAFAYCLDCSSSLALLLLWYFVYLTFSVALEYKCCFHTFLYRVICLFIVF